MESSLHFFLFCFQGTPVLGMLQDKQYYPGQIVLESAPTTYIVSFEDGEVRQVKIKDLIVCDLLALGQVWGFPFAFGVF